MAIALDAAGKYLTRTATVIDANSPYTAGGYVMRTTSNDQAIRVYGTDDAGGDFSNYESIKVDWFGNPAGIAYTIGATFVGPTYGTTNISAGTWFHLMIVRESVTSLKLYVNGSLEVTLATSISGRAATARMAMGALGGGGEDTTVGVLAAWNAWTRALNATQVASQYSAAQAAAVDPTNLWAEWLMLAGAGRVNDTSGNARHWTAHGTLTDVSDPPITYPSVGGATGTMTTNTGYWGP